MLNELIFQDCSHSHDPMVGCALEGVANVIAGVKDISIVLHSPQGCASTIAMGYDNHECDFTQRKVACTRLFESDIIMGATDKLRDLILKADETFRTRVMFVVGTCSADIIGEDIEGLCRILQSKVNAKLIPIHSGGFRGDYYAGMDLGLKVLQQLIQKCDGPKLERSVNLILPQAGLNPTWWADMNWVKDVLAAMGVETHCVFPYQAGQEEIALASSATANMMLTHDSGEEFLKSMHDQHGVPSILHDMPLPVGLTNTANWLRALADALNAREVAETIIAEGEAKVTDVLRRRGLMMIPRYRNAHVAVSGDASMVIAMTRMLFEDLEMVPELLLVRSNSKHARALLDAELNSMGISPAVAFGVDGFKVKHALAGRELDAVFGSAWEKYLGEELGIRCAFDLMQPTNRTCYRDGAYWGYDGMLNLLEVVANDWEAAFRSRAIRWEQFSS
jgi:light-independent protochlorophyllide reductase B subunit